MALVLLLGLPIVIMGIVTLRRFDGLYGQDAFAYYDYATGPLRAALLSLKLPPPFTWPPGSPGIGVRSRTTSLSPTVKCAVQSIEKPPSAAGAEIRSSRSSVRSGSPEGFT